MGINLFPVLPEIFIALMIIVILLVDAFVNENKKSISYVLTLSTLIIMCLLQYIVYQPFEQTTFNNMFVLDSLARGMKFITYITALIIIIYSYQYIKDKKFLSGEFYAIFLFAILGMMVMISASSLLILYVGLELLSLALYALVALDRDNVKASEAAMKFFILGALGSGILLYGISFIYGATGGHLQLKEVFFAIQNNLGQNHSTLVFGLVFIIAGLAFKLGLVPFHMWVPDVYEGSPMVITTIIGTVTKLTAVVFMIRFLINSLVLLSESWSVMLAILAYISLFLGNTVAIAQTNIKRMLAYSAIANMSFIAFGLMTVSLDGISATIFYIVTYVIAALGAFGVLLLLSHDDYECEKIEDLKGLGSSHPVYAGILMLTMFSLAGIPPFVGFYAKFKILESLISLGYIKTSIYIVIMSLIGAFYYIRIVKFMYFDVKQNMVNIGQIQPNLVSKIVLISNGMLLLILGILPVGLMNLCLNFLVK
ncbi:MAG TPA: NADH-quinone oxidoreductase subunit NuoN [Burkholderiales bacterium]|nr:NADH-quinone oxidoreductase subunit NuoN [Burkholderiales bacterium]